MKSIFRSEEMALSQLYLQPEAAYTCIAELGELGMVEFKDLNSNLNSCQRKFVNEVCRCDELERKLRFVENEMKNAEIEILALTNNVPTAMTPHAIPFLEETLEKLETELIEFNMNANILHANYFELIEMEHILRITNTLFQESDVNLSASDSSELLEDGFQDLNLSFVAGLLHRERFPTFERMLWRVCRGNVFVKKMEIEEPLVEPKMKKEVYKSVFIVFYQGEHLKVLIQKICDGFHASMCPCPATAAEHELMLTSVVTRIQELYIVRSRSQEHKVEILNDAAQHINSWFIEVQKVKAVYLTLNLLNVDSVRNCLIGECWCPINELFKIQMTLCHATEVSGSRIPSILHQISTIDTPPTYFRTNKFTKAFQGIVDAYGIATYSEMNPAIFTIITFPFLFSIMFSDAGHGLILALFGFILILLEKSLMEKTQDNEIFRIIFGGRYVITLMGLFSIYSGLIFNDVFSKSVNIFGSAWHVPKLADVGLHKEYTMNVTSDMSNTTYSFGIDPVWQLSANKITFLNSYKMKISVIFGVTHMLFGLCLSLWNHLHFKRWSTILFEFIPQMIFLLFIFGYLVVLIFYKWLAFGVTQKNAACAPSLLIIFINMCLLKYPKSDCGHDFNPGSVFYRHQQAVQCLLLGCAVLSVPVMLLGKPLYLRYSHRVQLKRRDSRALQERASVPTVDVLHSAPPLPPLDIRLEEQRQFHFADVFIRQCIHTIEFCLGCVSHTASYLRLWALSLAHAELSEVMWSMTLRSGLAMPFPYGIFGTTIVFFMFAMETLVVLLAMEGMSAFLHTLRLHWVEFQSKFYQGEGRPFNPLSFAFILEARKLNPALSAEEKDHAIG